MTTRTILLFGILTFIILFIMSVVFYKERTAFIDISYHLFCILRDDTFAIQNNRFGAFFTQLFPLMGSRMGFSLTAITIAYSTSFVLLPFFTFLGIHIGLKNPKVGLVYLLFMTLMTTHTFYWIQSELPQGMAFLFIFVALLDNIMQKNGQIPVRFIAASNFFLFLICFAHPLLVVPFYFTLGFYGFVYPQRRSLLWSMGISFFFLYLVKYLFFKTTYDTQAMDGLKNIPLLIQKYFSLRSCKNLGLYLIRDYYFAIILLLAILWVYVKQQKFVKLLFVLTFILGYTFLINISYSEGADQFYLENQYLLLAIMVGFPFVYDVLPLIKYPKGKEVTIGLILLIGLIRIFNTHPFYTNRVQWLRNTISEVEQLPKKKVIIPYKSEFKETLLMTWASSYEFWLLSSLEKGYAHSIIIEENKNEFDWAMPQNKVFIAKWGTFEYERLNKKYFNFVDEGFYAKKE